MQNKINTNKETISMLQCPFWKNDIHTINSLTWCTFLFTWLSYISIYIFLSFAAPKITPFSTLIVLFAVFTDVINDMIFALLYFCTALPSDKECFKKDHVCSITHILYLLLDIYALHNLIKVKRAFASSHLEYSVCLGKMYTRFIRFKICSFIVKTVADILLQTRKRNILQYIQ